MSEGGGSGISNTAYADALARARQLAAKLGSLGPQGQGGSSPPQAPPPVGIKRPAMSFDNEPDNKRMASMNDPFGAQLAAMKGGGGGSSFGSGGFTSMGMTGSGKSCMEEIRIPDALVGLIIGRGGEQVSRIQAEAGCKVQVAPDSGGAPERPCYLQGTKESIDKAKDLIMDIVNSKSHEVGRPSLSFGATKQPSAGMTGGPGTTTIEMTIPGAKVGLVIGKGGETIRNLQDKSGTKMFILQENMFEECDKPLRIVGEPDLVEHARQLVMDLINDTPPKSDFFKPKGEYGDHGDMGGGGGGGGGPGGPGGGRRTGLGFGSLETMKFPVPKISVGLIIGKGGEMIKKIQMDTGAKVQFDPVNQNLGDMDEQLAIITGKPDQLRLAQLKIEELVETALHGPPGRAPGGGGGGGGNWGGGGGGRRGDQDEERLNVPVNRVGMVIGKGGETIRTINQQSGAHSEIDRNGPNDGPERIFVIRGSRQQIEHAKSLIMEKVNTLPPKGHGNGGEYGQSQGWNQQYGGSGNQWGGGASAAGGGGDAQAQWAAYYAQYYNPAAQAQTAGAAAGGQADYTQQWIEYLRAQGQNQQADMLEKQMKQSQSGSTNGNSSSGGDGGAPGGPSSAAAPAPPGGASNGGDYSQAWADHYRSVGKIAEAEQIENYIKAQKAGQANGASGGPSAPAAAGDAAYQQYYQQYAAYYGAAGYPGYPGGPTAPTTAGSGTPSGAEGTNYDDDSYGYEYGASFPPYDYPYFEMVPVDPTLQQYWAESGYWW